MPVLNDRVTRRLQHGKEVSSRPKKGIPSPSDLKEGVIEFRFIDGYGLRAITLYAGKVYYFNGSTTLS